MFVCAFIFPPCRSFILDLEEEGQEEEEEKEEKENHNRAGQTMRFTEEPRKKEREKKKKPRHQKDPLASSYCPLFYVYMSTSLPLSCPLSVVCVSR